VETVTCRLVPYAAADGAHNMAADEALLESALSGVASLRFYGWSEPTVSLGYFQPVEKRDNDKRLSRLPFVRRPTGGDALVHHFELTYSLALPPGCAGEKPQAWPAKMHGMIADALKTMGVATRLSETCTPPASSVLCFKRLVQGDLMIGESKIAGSAQRRRKGALLQHGAVLLTTSTFAPLVAGIRELSGHALSAPTIRDGVIVEVIRQTGWTLTPGDWTEPEKRRVKELTVGKYTQDSWNRKR